MAALDRKRSRHERSLDPRKKQRKAANGLKEQKKVRHSVGLDALPWSEARLPDRLDDAEGFLGLEEVSDVEVVKDQQNGRLEYRHSKPAADAWFEDATKLEEDEWDGFSDPGTDSAETSSNLAKPSNGTMTQARSRTEEPMMRDHSKSDSKGSGFEILKDASDDEIDVSSWNPLNLSSEVLSSLAKLRFAEPTAIQSSAIPEILDGNDVIGKAATGSGKTLAFGIPILEHCLKHSIKNLRGKGKGFGEDRKVPPAALILSPTRELAHQLSAHLTDLCSNITSTSPKTATITGGLSLQKQQRILAKSDIIVGTPGRLWEIISSSKGLMPWLSETKFLVLDEADRLLSEGHFKELEEILNSLDRTDDNQTTTPPKTPPQDRQTLIFSATFAPSLQHKLTGHQKSSTLSSTAATTDSMAHLLSRLNFRSTPKFINVSPLSHLPFSLREHIIECSALEKDLYLYALLLCHFPSSRTLVFTNSINSVRRLVPFLQNLNLPAHALHSQMPQKSRLRSVERFSSSSTQPESKEGEKQGKEKGSILVATDVAARGLDIPNVQAVLHYHLPRAADTYVHRSGRTARKGNTGASVLICSPEEVMGMKRLVAKIHAQSSSASSAAVRKDSKDRGIHTLALNRALITRLKPRTVLAKQIADAELAKGKQGHDDKWLRDAAEELGVDLDDSEDFEGGAKGKGRKKKEERAKGWSKADVLGMKAELKGLLEKRVNVGVSERYLSAGGWDVEALLEEGERRGEFLGVVDGLG